MQENLVFCAGCGKLQGMNRRNYMRELDRIIEKNGERRPTVLLHSCCGPCSSSVLELLAKHFKLSVLWYNPNLYPEEEYDRRLDALKTVIEKLGLNDSVELIVEPWQSEKYFEAVRGLENEPEGGKRCAKCFELRLKRAAEIARERGFDYFCTTLTVSRHKDAVLINAIAEEQAAQQGALWLPSEFKKRGGEDRSTELSREFGIYRQLYCGCVYSLHNRENHG